MGVGKIDPTTSVTSQVAGQAKKAAEALKAAAAAKTDRVELNNRNPANKKELMATYSNLRTQMPNMQRQAIVNGMTGNTTAVNFTAPKVEAGNTATRAPAPAAAAPQTAPVPAGNKVVNGERMNVNITNAAGNTGNTVTGPNGFANNNNQVAINGANNNVNLAGTPAAGTSAATQAATGGPGINNTNVAVQGSNNAVQFTGGLQQGNNVNINGANNAVNVGNAVSNANVNVTGNNVAVNMEQNDLLTRDQNNWNVAVNASNVNVTVKNGQATVTGANGATTEGLKIEINNEKRTVTVTAAADKTASPNPAQDIGA